MVKLIGYCRINRADGELEKQQNLIKNYAKEKELPYELHHEIKSGVDKEMTLLNELIESATSGDILAVTDRSRLTRNASQLTKIMKKISDYNIQLVVLQNN